MRYTVFGPYIERLARWTNKKDAGWYFAIDAFLFGTLLLSGLHGWFEIAIEIAFMLTCIELMLHHLGRAYIIDDGKETHLFESKHRHIKLRILHSLNWCGIATVAVWTGVIASSFVQVVVGFGFFLILYGVIFRLICAMEEMEDRMQ